VLAWAVSATFIVGPAILHSQAGVGISPILTGSMRPYANPGDVFITKLVKASNLKVGDIISVHSQSSGIFYAHRIVEIREQSGLLRIVTQGDSNGAPEVDPFMVGPNKTVSREITRVKWLGRPLVFLTSIQGRQAGLALMVIANVIGLMLFLFRKRTPDAQLPIFHEGPNFPLWQAHQEIKKKDEELRLFREIIAHKSVQTTTTYL
jgi:signal peptidase I